VEFEIRARSGGVCTRWFKMGVWASGTESIERHSVNGQRSGRWRVLTDNLQSIGMVFADAYRYRLTLFTEEWGISPLVRSVSIAASDSYRHGKCLKTPVDSDLWVGSSRCRLARKWCIRVAARCGVVRPHFRW